MKDPKELFEKVFIRSEADLPKVDGIYFCYHKTGRMDEEKFNDDLLWKSWWLANIASYLQPIEQPAEKVKHDPHNDIYGPGLDNYGRDKHDWYDKARIGVNTDCNTSPVMSPKPQEEITDGMDNIISELKKDFSGDDSYLSGVNDGMYHLFRKHLIEKVI